ncbi:MAG: lipopolysaccharide heptosyltransferase I [Acidiferrobacter sp.]
MRILIVKTSSLGDVIHNLPAVTDLAAQRPEATIDWLVEGRFAEIPALHPAIATVLPLALRQWLRAPWRPTTWRAVQGLRAQLRARAYDVVIDSQGLLKSACVARLAGAPLVGPDRLSAREPLAANLYQRGVRVRGAEHAVTRNRTLIAGAFGYPVPITPPDYGLTAPAPPPGPWPPHYCLALHASSRRTKLWGPERWQQLGQDLAHRGWAILLPSGSAAEARAAATIATAIGASAQALPPMTLTALAGLMGGAQAVIGVDTGLLHLAAALKRPTVGLFTDSDPQQTGVRAAAPTANLGGRAENPTAHAVLAALATFGILPPR